MKNILIGMAIALCIAAGAVKTDVLTIKPSVPKSTIVLADNYTYASDFSKNIRKYVKQGYIVKALSADEKEYIAVMEKY